MHLDQLNNSSSERTPYSLVKLGKLYASAGRFNEATKYYNEAIDMLPEELGFYYFRAIAEFNMNELEKALEDFETALSNNPLNKYEILNFTGAVRFKLGDSEGALLDLERVLKKNKGNISELVISQEDYEELKKAV